MIVKNSQVLLLRPHLAQGEPQDEPMDFTSHSGLNPMHFEKMPQTMEFLKPEGGMQRGAVHGPLWVMT